MGTKTQKSQTEGYIETIIHGHENGENGHADHGSEHVDDGYETDPTGEEPTPVTTEADEFPAVIQAGMWVQLLSFQTYGTNGFAAGLVGLVEEDFENGECGINFAWPEPCVSPSLYLPLGGVKSGDPLPDFLEQVNALEPAAIPDSTPLDDLDGENAEPSEAETVYTTETIEAETALEIQRERLATVTRLANFERPTDAVTYVMTNLYDLATRAESIAAELDDAKAVVKGLREDLDDANAKLRAAALDLRRLNEPLPLFPENATGNSATVSKLRNHLDTISTPIPDGDSDTFAGVESQVPTATAMPATPDESWRIVSIDVLNLPGKIPEQLRDHHPTLDTIGAIRDFLDKPHNFLTDVKGIGQGKADKICDALEAFWRKNPQSLATLAGFQDEADADSEPVHLGQTDDDNSSTEQGAVAFDFGQTLDDNPHARGSSDWDEWRAGFKERAGMGDGDEQVGDEDL